MNKKILVIIFLLLAAGYSLLATGFAAEPVHIQWSPNPFSPDNDGKNDTTILVNTNFAKEDIVSLTIYDLQSRPVRHLIEEKEGENLVITWNGENEFGEVVPVGLYIWQLKINDKYRLGTVVVVKK